MAKKRYTNTFSVVLSDPVKARVAEIAIRRSTSEASIVREAIEAYLNKIDGAESQSLLPLDLRASKPSR
jgi:predicted DNA-binding protein